MLNQITIKDVIASIIARKAFYLPMILFLLILQTQDLVAHFAVLALGSYAPDWLTHFKRQTFIACVPFLSIDFVLSMDKSILKRIPFFILVGFISGLPTYSPGMPVVAALFVFLLIFIPKIGIILWLLIRMERYSLQESGRIGNSDFGPADQRPHVP